MNGITEAEARSRIEAECVKPGWDKLGYSLLYCPWKNLVDPEVLFITLNPAGNCPATDVSVKIGSAYVVESWGGRPKGQAPLQIQIQRLFCVIGESLDQALTGCLVPFRSPRWRDLERPNEAVEFGKCLWRDLLVGSRPRLTITLGAVAFEKMRELLSGAPTHSLQSHWRIERDPHIWVSDYDGGRLVGLPHLSTYKLLSDCWPEKQALRKDAILSAINAPSYQGAAG